MDARHLVALGVAIIAVAGCSDDSGDSQTASSTTSTTTADEPVLPEPITADGAERVKLEDRLQTELKIENGGPDWMVSAFGSLWVKTDDGTVLRLDPDTGKEIAQIVAGPFDEPLCQGLGASDDAIWACPAIGEPGGTVVRIDPDANEIVSTLKVRKIPDQGRIVSAAGRVWLLTEGGERLTGVDLKSEKTASELRLGETCTDLVAAGDTLWAFCPIEGHVLRIDAAAAKVTAEGDFAGARTGAVSGDLWVGFEDGLAQVDPATLEIVALYDASPAFGGRVYATDDEVWAREEGGNFLTRIDPDEQRIVEIIEAPKLSSGGDVVVIGDSVWASAYDDLTLVQLSR
jgi:sugar lactone lactonase YvrE